MMTCRICGKRFVVTWPQHWVYRRKDVFLCSEDCMIVYDAQTTRAANGFGPKKKGEEENMAGKLTKEQRWNVVEIAIQGGSPIEYLKKCGIANPYASWDWIKKSLAKKDPQKYLEMSHALAHKKPEKTTEELETEAAEVINGEIDLERDKEELALEDLKFPMKVKGVKETAAGLQVTVTAKKVDRVPPVEIHHKEPITPETPEKAMDIQNLEIQGGVNYQLKVEESRKARKPFKVIGLETEFGTFMMGTVNGVIHFESEGNAEISMVTEDWVKMADLLPEILRELGVDA